MNKQLTVVVGLVERDSRFLFTRRVSHANPSWHHRWELPGGKIEAGETPLHALHREIHEETQLKIRQPQLLGVYTQHWEMAFGVQQTFILLYHCLAERGEVILLEDVNDDYRWETLEEAMLRTDLLRGTLDMLKELAPEKF